VDIKVTASKKRKNNDKGQPEVHILEVMITTLITPRQKDF